MTLQAHNSNFSLYIQGFYLFSLFVFQKRKRFHFSKRSILCVHRSFFTERYPFRKIFCSFSKFLFVELPMLISSFSSLNIQIQYIYIYDISVSVIYKMTEHYITVFIRGLILYNAIAFTMKLDYCIF